MVSSHISHSFVPDISIALLQVHQKLHLYYEPFDFACECQSDIKGRGKGCSTVTNTSACLFRFLRFCHDISFSFGSNPRLVGGRIMVRLHRISILDLKCKQSIQSINQPDENISINQTKKKRRVVLYASHRAAMAMNC